MSNVSGAAVMPRVVPCHHVSQVYDCIMVDRGTPPAYPPAGPPGLRVRSEKSL